MRAVFALVFFISTLNALYTNERILYAPISPADKAQMGEIENLNDVAVNEIVAVNQLGIWRYACVKIVPDSPLWYGIVNFRPEGTYGGFAIHFKNNVRKLPDLSDKKFKKSKETPSKNE